MRPRVPGMRGESYCRQLRSLLLNLCYIFWVLINSLVCWFAEHGFAPRCVSLLAELSHIASMAAPVMKLLPLLGKACTKRHYTHHLNFLETVCKQVGRSAGERVEWNQFEQRVNWKRRKKTWTRLIWTEARTRNAGERFRGGKKISLNRD